MKEKKQQRSIKRVSRLTQAAIFIFVFFSVTAVADTPLPNIPKAVKGEQCVEDTDFMRKNHMELLLHQRDDTMHEGIRTKKHSLNECLVCHAVKGEDNRPVTVADPRHFCSTCHQYAAVKVDCFQCHSSTPAVEKKISSLDMKITNIKNMSQ